MYLLADANANRFFIAMSKLFVIASRALLYHYINELRSLRRPNTSGGASSPWRRLNGNRTDYGFSLSAAAAILALKRFGVNFRSH